MTKLPPTADFARGSWDAVMQALERLYHDYYAPRLIDEQEQKRIIQKRLEELMAAYDDWLG